MNLIRIFASDSYHIRIRAAILGTIEKMAQKRFEECLEATNKEIKEIKVCAKVTSHR